MEPLRLLHLVGSAYNEFYCNLSQQYAQCCFGDTAYFSSAYDFRIAFITPDGLWRFPRTLNSKDIAQAQPYSLNEALEQMKNLKIDLVIPHMYCIPGMTHYRALFDLIKIPYIGNTPDVMAITAHKGKTKAIVAAAGVRVPRGQLLRKGESPNIEPPAIVKPANADNSLGLSLVKDQTEYADALEKAFQHADEVIVEAFIEPGREVRCSLIMRDGELIGLPLEEFPINANERPIRTHSEKFPNTDADGKFTGWKKDDAIRPWIAQFEDPITEKVHQVAKQCHLALGCRQYSMFDFRIDVHGEPWFLEAGLYCSFGYGSGIPHVAKASGIPLDKLFELMINEALKGAQ